MKRTGPAITLIAFALLASANAQACPAQQPSHDANVRRLVSKLEHIAATHLSDSAKRAEQQKVFAALEGLGPSAVPAIIARMNDRRPLAVAQMSLVNRFPGAFEGVRHYGPELIVDALDAVLNQMTGLGGSIVNGGTEQERQSAVAAWRAYAASLPCPAS